MTVTAVVLVLVVVAVLLVCWLARVRRPRNLDERLSPFHLAPLPLVACAGMGATASRRRDCYHD